MSALVDTRAQGWVQGQKAGAQGARRRTSLWRHSGDSPFPGSASYGDDACRPSKFERFGFDRQAYLVRDTAVAMIVMAAKPYSTLHSGSLTSSPKTTQETATNAASAGSISAQKSNACCHGFERRLARSAGCVLTVLRNTGLMLEASIAGAEAQTLIDIFSGHIGWSDDTAGRVTHPVLDSLGPVHSQHGDPVPELIGGRRAATSQPSVAPGPGRDPA